MKVNISISLTYELVKEMDSIIKEQKSSRSLFIERAIKSSLETISKNKKKGTKNVLWKKEN